MSELKGKRDGEWGIEVEVEVEVEMEAKSRDKRGRVSNGRE